VYKAFKKKQNKKSQMKQLREACCFDAE